jgi:drug/metabolite transporter (DMT)-like permease
VKSTITHRRAIILMIIAPTLWSIAGVVTRHLSPELQQQGRFEITFWRSVFAALLVAGYLVFARRDLVGALRRAGAPGLLSGVMWAVMFVTFMLALTLTSTANTLIMLSIAPLTTALLAWAVLRAPIPPRTWLAIFIAMAGMGWMFAGSVKLESPSSVLGMLIALGAPLASAVNVIILKKRGESIDLIPAVLIGGIVSAVIMLPFAVPFIAEPGDIALLAMLGVFQLGVPCILLVVAARHLQATEVALLALIEVLLGPLWAWIGANEAPTSATLIGGAIVLSALVLNEVVAPRRAAPSAT